MSREVDAYGVVRYGGEAVIELLLNGYQLSDMPLRFDAQIERYNTMCRSHNKDAFVVKPIDDPDGTPEDDEARRRNRWWIPPPYDQLDVRALLLDRCDRADEIARVNLEMDMFEQRDMLPVLRLMCFLVDDWRRRGVVWGVGRGSSVASYSLFLLHVHRIDSLAYGLSIGDFLK